ncbi:GD20421 [Drosophila simulans]|uniref:GD20421 n=1 Tax=Drosophila simulans TaxID=7240 RepID=B4QZV2_DROSI|nr:GD20421 [Drosophila simulans]
MSLRDVSCGRVLAFLFVPREINEVFELRKVQRLEQQLREQLEERLSQAGVQQLDELSRSTESDSGFDSSSTTATSSTPAAAGAVTSGKPVTTKLRALPPPPLSPTKTTSNCMPTPPVQADDVNIWACKFLRDLDSLMATGDKLPPHLAALAEGSGSGSASSSPTSRTAPILLSAAASAAIQSRLGKGSSSIMEHQLQQQQQQNGLVLKPEKHVSTQFKILCK